MYPTTPELLTRGICTALHNSGSGQEISKTIDTQLIMIEGLQKELQTQAAISFAKGEILGKRRRQTLARAFGRMTFARAWVTIKNYAIGKVNESGEELKVLVHAWLVLGERRFQIVFSVVSAFKEVAQTGVLIVRRIVDKIQQSLPSVSVSDILSEIESVKFQFRAVKIVT